MSDDVFRITGDPGGPVLDLIPDDEAMYVRDAPTDAAREHYFNCGRSALRCVRLALAAAEHATVERMLDFPCGHGRVLRALAAAWPDAERHASDLLTAGVEFCAKHLGAVAIESHKDPARVRLRGPYDVIWVGSLFTHFDVPQWRAFLALFHAALRPGGVCVFTSHGRRSVEMIRAGSTTYGLADPMSLLAPLAKTGFAYTAYADSPDYGISLSTSAFVSGEIERLPGSRLVLALEHGWADHQDAFAWQRTPG